MVQFLIISVAFWGAALIRGWRLFRSWFWSDYLRVVLLWDPGLNRGKTVCARYPASHLRCSDDFIVDFVQISQTVEWCSAYSRAALVWGPGVNTRNTVFTSYPVRHWRHWRRSGVFIVNFEQISHIVLVLALLTLNE